MNPVTRTSPSPSRPRPELLPRHRASSTSSCIQHRSPTRTSRSPYRLEPASFQHTLPSAVSIQTEIHLVVNRPAGRLPLQSHPSISRSHGGGGLLRPDEHTTLPNSSNANHLSSSNLPPETPPAMSKAAAAAAAAASLPPPPPEVAHLVEQLQRHHLAPDASLLSSSAHSDLLQAREEVAAERARYLEALAVYAEAMAMVEEYQHATAAGSVGAGKKLNGSPQVYESLEHHLAVAEAAQRLRLPLLSQDGEVHEEVIEKLSTLSRASFDSTATNATPSSISTSYNNYSSTGSALTAAAGSGDSELVEPGAGGVPDRFLGITSDYLYQVQQQQPAMTVDMVDYQRTVVREIEAQLEAKCDALTDLFAMDERDSSSMNHISSARLPERVKLIIEEIEKEESLLLEDLASMDRKFAEHYNVLEQILAVLIQFVKDKKLEHQHQYDDVKKTWLIKRCRTMNAKLSYLEHHLLRDTYTKETVPALHRIRKYLVEATKEASNSYNEAVSRLREYQGVDPHFDVIARQYHEIVKKLEGMQWTIHQVEMDLKPASS